MIRSATIATTICLILAGLSIEATGEHRRLGSISVGNPNHGKIVRAKGLPSKGRGFYSNPKRPNAEATFGTDEMIAMLIKAGGDLDRAAPGAPLYINDISFREGGPISHHASHRVGRDVDLMFFAFDTDGEVAEPVCIPYDPEGKAVWDHDTSSADDDEPRRFDARRNWLVLRSMVENESAHVQRIYVAEHIRSLLLEHAREAGEPTWVIERLGDVMCQPGGAPHDDHFHVRLFCTAEDYRHGCRDSWPMYPWRRTELATLGLTAPRLKRPRKRRRASRARRRASPRKRTSPGRFWCP